MAYCQIFVLFVCCYFLWVSIYQPSGAGDCLINCPFRVTCYWPVGRSIFGVIAWRENGRHELVWLWFQWSSPSLIPLEWNGINQWLWWIRQGLVGPEIGQVIKCYSHVNRSDELEGHNNNNFFSNERTHFFTPSFLVLCLPFIACVRPFINPWASCTKTEWFVRGYNSIVGPTRNRLGIWLIVGRPSD